MTAGFPLSISGRPDGGKANPVTAALDDLEDGLVRLRRREDTRLWFRKPDPAAPVEMRPPVHIPAPMAKLTENLGTDKLVCEMVRVVQAGRPSLVAGPTPGLVAEASALSPALVETMTATSSAPRATSAAASSSGKVEWRDVQAGAPVLLLSAGPVLECSRPGPILGPGMRYRITGMTGSVVAMEVMHANGDTRSGYANAVDLRCIEPKIHTGELRTEKGLTGRLRLSRLAATTFGLFGG